MNVAVSRKQPPHLLGNGREDHRRRCRAAHQRRHPPQRRLLVGELLESLA